MNIGVGLDNHLEMIASLTDEQLFRRAHPWGQVMYAHPQDFPKGAFLPGDLGEQIARLIATGEELHTSSGALDKPSRKIAGIVAGQMTNLAQFSGDTDYGRGFITGDIGAFSQREIDGVERKVLVIPQGLRRAKATANQFQLAQYHHPLAGDPEAILRVMALTMNGSQLENPYFRLKAMVDGRSTGVNFDILEGKSPPVLVTASTWEFANVPSYLLPNKRKVVVESAFQPEGTNPVHELKASSRYQARLAAIYHELTTELAKQHGASDLAFRGAGNDLFVDLLYTNLAHLGKDPQRDGWTVVAFPQPTTGNGFFNGKTQATLHEILERVGDQYQIRPVKVRNTEELAQALGSKYSSMKDIVLDKVTGMLAPGTFRGPQWVDRIVFANTDWKEMYGDPVTKQAAEQAVRMFNDAVWGLNGGLPYAPGQSFAQDGRYCTVFDPNALSEGRVEPLQFREIKEVKKEK